jgi:putative spermidine/putrescine transport system permease protein
MKALARLTPNAWWGLIRGIVCCLLVFYLTAPLIIVLIISFSSAQFLTFPPPGFSLQWYRNLFRDPVWFNALLTSVEIMIPAAICATALGTAAAYGLARSRTKLAGFVTGLILAPVVVPAIITAAGIFAVFRNVGLHGTLTGLIIAHTVLTIPYVFVTVSAGLKVLDPRLEAAAMTLGARPIIVFRRIVLPLILPAVLSGLLFAMVVSFDELIVSLFISTPVVRPIAVQMWSNVMGDVDPTIAAVATVLFAFSLLALMTEHAVRQRRLRVTGDA